MTPPSLDEAFTKQGHKDAHIEYTLHMTKGSPREEVTKRTILGDPRPTAVHDWWHRRGSKGATIKEATVAFDTNRSTMRRRVELLMDAGALIPTGERDANALLYCTTAARRAALQVTVEDPAPKGFWARVQRERRRLQCNGTWRQMKWLQRWPLIILQAIGDHRRRAK